MAKRVMRRVEDGQRFGFREEEVLEAVEIPLGPDQWVCPKCGREEVVSGQFTVDSDKDRDRRQDGLNEEGFIAQKPRNAKPYLAARTALRMTGLGGDGDAQSLCAGCGEPLSEKDLKKAERVMVPRVSGVRRVANGQEVISIAGGLELNTPVWANEMHEFPYLQWQAEVHRAKLKASYPHVADRIESAPSMGAEDVYARVSRISVEQGVPTIHPGDALMNLITFDRTWLRPWAFDVLDDEAPALHGQPFVTVT